MSSVSFILHKPQLSENIGACARAIKNFNFNKLAVINPKPAFPNDKIVATSVGAKEIIQNCKVYDNLELATKNIDYLIATSSRFRNKNIKHISLNDLSKLDFNKKIGFLFGSEASGLSNKEIVYANCTMQIPTNPNFKSLNLSHSLTIICYEIFKLLNDKKIKNNELNLKVSSKSKISSLLAHLISLLEKKDFFIPKEKRHSMILNINNLIYRLEPNDKELRILASIISTLSKK